MKKIISILLPLLLVTGVFADSAFNTSLRYGSRGQDVREMQEFLIDQGYLTGSVTGNFYALTLKAVKQFQAKNGLSASGFWGPLTRQKAIELTDLKASDDEATTTPVVVPKTQIQAPVQPIIQYIYTPAPTTTITPPVDTTAQQRQAIQDEYNRTVNILTNKKAEIEYLKKRADGLYRKYTKINTNEEFPTFVNTDYQKDFLRKAFDQNLTNTEGEGGLGLSLYVWNKVFQNETDNLDSLIRQASQDADTKISQIK